MAGDVQINDFGEEIHAYVGDVLLATACRQQLATDHRRTHWVITGAGQPSLVETKDRARHVLKQKAREVLTLRAFAAKT